MSIRYVTIHIPGPQGPPGDPGEFGGPNIPNPVLKQWAASEAFALTAITRDADGVVSTASVTWPDGSTGTFNRTQKNTSAFAIDAFTVTHALSGKTARQPAVTRDAHGAVTAQPEIIIE